MKLLPLIDRLNELLSLTSGAQRSPWTQHDSGANNAGEAATTNGGDSVPSEIRVGSMRDDSPASEDLREVSPASIDAPRATRVEDHSRNVFYNNAGRRSMPETVLADHSRNTFFGVADELTRVTRRGQAADRVRLALER